MVAAVGIDCFGSVIDCYWPSALGSDLRQALARERIVEAATRHDYVLGISATAFSMINQQLKRDGYSASIDPSIFMWLANITDPELRDTATVRLEIVPKRHQSRPNNNARQIAQFIWHLVEGQGCQREAAGEPGHGREATTPASVRISSQSCRRSSINIFINMHVLISFYAPSGLSSSTPPEVRNKSQRCQNYGKENATNLRDGLLGLKPHQAQSCYAVLIVD